MPQRITGVVLFGTVVIGTSALIAARAQPVGDPPRASAMTVHEWGTFTSVAGENGQAVQWTPLDGASDLPCFVRVLNPTNIKVGGLRGFLPTLKATVRMETPVLYFYSQEDETARVKVGFPQGLMTEWYPDAVVPPVTPWMEMSTNTGSIEWQEVRIRSGATPTLPEERDSSHYYAARETDASMVQVGGQHEKFLFYRGLASFPVSVSAKSFSDGSVEVRAIGPNEVGIPSARQDQGLSPCLQADFRRSRIPADDAARSSRGPGAVPARGGGDARDVA